MMSCGGNRGSVSTVANWPSAATAPRADVMTDSRPASSGWSVTVASTAGRSIVSARVPNTTDGAALRRAMTSARW